MDKSIERFVELYKEERYFSEFSERYPEWLNNVEDEEEKQVLNKILSHLNFICRKEIRENLTNQMFKYKEQLDQFENVNIIPMISENRRHNGSYELIQQIIEIDKELVYRGQELLPYQDTVVYDVREIKEDIETIIIIDDICGTGGTLDKFLIKNNLYFNEKKVFIFFLVVTNTALTNIGVLENKYNVKIDYIHVLSKIQDAGYLNEREFEILQNIEKSLWRKGHNNILGFKNSQLLLGFSHNIPNNTVSSIWYKPELGERSNWNELFSRYTKRSRKSRKVENYNVRRAKWNK